MPKGAGGWLEVLMCSGLIRQPDSSHWLVLDHGTVQAMAWIDQSLWLGNG